MSVGNILNLDCSNRTRQHTHAKKAELHDYRKTHVLQYVTNIHISIRLSGKAHVSASASVSIRCFDFPSQHQVSERNFHPLGDGAPQCMEQCNDTRSNDPWIHPVGVLWCVQSLDSIESEAKIPSAVNLSHCWSDGC